MSQRCDVCGKGVQVGMNVPHSKHKTKKRFKPNLQSKTIMIGEDKQRLKVCTSCLKTL
jgi:large subunit ribosomal protein L28